MKKIDDYNLTEDLLQNILNEGGEELKKMLNYMKKFNSNIIGSNAYFFKCRSKLELLIEQEGMPTFWFALLATNNH